MLDTFCATSNLRNFLQSPRCPEYLSFISPILDECYRGEHRGTLVNDIKTFNSDTSSNVTVKTSAPTSKIQPLEVDIYDALVKASTMGKLGTCKAYPDAVCLPRHKIRGLQYCDYKTGRKDSNIFFQPEAGKPLVPGRIRQILSLPGDNSEEGVVFIAVQRYKEVIHDSPNPFKQFEDFGAGLWSRHLGEVEIIRPADNVCHGIMRHWDNDLLVMRPLNRVSRRMGHDKCHC